MKSLLALILFVLQLTASAGEMADELVERRATTDKAADALLDGNFPELERQVKLYMIADRRSSSGAFKIEQFDDGISEAMTFSGQDADVNYSEMISMTKAWVAEHPASPSLTCCTPVPCLRTPITFEAGDTPTPFHHLRGRHLKSIPKKPPRSS